MNEVESINTCITRHFTRKPPCNGVSHASIAPCLRNSHLPSHSAGKPLLPFIIRECATFVAQRLCKKLFFANKKKKIWCWHDSRESCIVISVQWFIKMTILKAIPSPATLTHCVLVCHICIITGVSRRCCRILGINTLPEHMMTYFLLNPLGTNLNNTFIFNFSICFLISPTTSTRFQTFAYRARSVVKARDARHRCQWTSGKKRFVHNPVKCSSCAFCRNFAT